MYSIRKKIAAFLLLALVAAPLLVSLCRMAQQQYIRHCMQERLEAAVLQTINIPEAALHWVKKDREIIVDGRLFDVKKITASGSSFIVTGLFDDAEIKIVKKLAEEAAGSNNMACSKTMAQLLFAVYSCSTATFTLSAPPAAAPEKITFGYSSSLCSRSIAVSTPPPDRA